MNQKPKAPAQIEDCFIIMPITTRDDQSAIYGGDSDHFQHVLECLFIPAVKQAGFNPIPPIMKGSEIIQGQVVKQLSKARLVLCDMSGLNANVFFELGIRWACPDFSDSGFRVMVG
jgi:hypothetical protein